MPGAAIVLATSLFEGAALGNLGDLLDRTEFGSHPTSVAGPIILAMYVVCAIAVALAVCSLFSRRIARYLSIGLAVIAVLSTAGFAWLNLSETVCEGHKELGCAPLLYHLY